MASAGYSASNDQRIDSSSGPSSIGNFTGGSIGVVQTNSAVELAYLGAGKALPESSLPVWLWPVVAVVGFVALLLLIRRVR